MKTLTRFIPMALFVASVLTMVSCTTRNFYSRSYWRESQENFHRVNADNQVYFEWIRHTNYPATSSKDYCKRIEKIPHRAPLSYYGSITEECRGGIYNHDIEELRLLGATH
jgi:hypothetical protein